MTGIDELRIQNEELQSRYSNLIAAILRISSTLDMDHVLHEIVESARALTGARMGVIVVTDEGGRPQDYLFTGLTEEELQQVLEWQDALPLFEQLRNLQRPVRLADLPAYLQSLGLSSFPLAYKTLQGSPLLHRGIHVGNFFVSDKDDGTEFTAEDENVLELFAAQAATVIVNGRTLRDEQRAKAGLEALIDTSPVGVVVLNARNGHLVSLNREAQRVADVLMNPGQTLTQLMQSLTCRISDGKELKLEEISLVKALRYAQPRRGEDVVLSVEDGRNIRLLVNATPIHSDNGEIESLVVTMQDLAPLEELERQRAGFLSMVSHELRTPLTSIKGSTASVLTASPELDPAETREFFRIIDAQADQMRGLISDLLDVGRIDSGKLSVNTEPSDVIPLVEQARNTFISSGSRHNVSIDVPSDIPAVIADRRRIVQVLNNLFVNAARFSPEASQIQVSAVRDGVHVAISVSDEGRGVEVERLPHLFSRHTDGNSKNRTVRVGLGLSICKGLVEAHGGRIWAESDGLGHGMCVTFTIPVFGKPKDNALSQPSQRSRHESESTRILVVDDDPLTLRMIRDVLQKSGYTPLITGDPSLLAYLIRTEKPGLVLLDLVLPDTDGIELMNQVPELVDLPVIFISGYRTDESIVKALEAGAADYIVKPFSPTELVARVQAALRQVTSSGVSEFGELAIDYDRCQVSVAGRQIELTGTEYELLHELSIHAGTVVTYETLLRRIWQRPVGEGSVAVRTYVKRLRRKLGDDAAKPSFIFNKRGIGYSFVSLNDP